MERIVDWLRRLHEAAPEVVREHIFRTVTPGPEPPSLHDSLIELQPVGLLAGRPGESSPSTMGLLRFLDTAPLGTHGFSLATEFAAVVTLLARRRFEVAMEIPVTAPPSPATFFLGYGAAVDRELIGPFPKDVGDTFGQYLARMQSLSAKDLAALGAACKLHHGSALLSQSDIRSAYVLLVAALEVLSQRYGNPPSPWEAWERSTTWDKLFTEQALTPKQQDAIRSELLRDRHLRLKATVREYVATRLPESFWSGKLQQWSYAFHLPAGTWGEPHDDTVVIDQLLPRDRTVLGRALGHTYDLRSGIVHRGIDLFLEAVGIKNQVSVSPEAPLPYAILRCIVAELITTEFLQHSRPEPLPKFRLVQKSRAEAVGDWRPNHLSGPRG